MNLFSDNIRFTIMAGHVIGRLKDRSLCHPGVISLFVAMETVSRIDRGDWAIDRILTVYVEIHCCRFPDTKTIIWCAVVCICIPYSNHIEDQLSIIGAPPWNIVAMVIT